MPRKSNAKGPKSAEDIIRFHARALAGEIHEERYAGTSTHYAIDRCLMHIDAAVKEIRSLHASATEDRLKDAVVKAAMKYYSKVSTAYLLDAVKSSENSPEHVACARLELHRRNLAGKGERNA